MCIGHGLIYWKLWQPADILDNVSYTPERAKQFDFSVMPIRSEAYYLFVPEGQKDKYQHKEDFFGKRIGVGRDTTVSSQLRQWNKDNGLNLISILIKCSHS